MNFGLKCVLRAINTLLDTSWILSTQCVPNFYPLKFNLETSFLGYTIEEMIGKIYRQFSRIEREII